MLLATVQLPLAMSSFTIGGLALALFLFVCLFLAPHAYERWGAGVRERITRGRSTGEREDGPGAGGSERGCGDQQQSGEDDRPGRSS